MALFNYTAKEITLKVVFYGPGFSGKTTSLQYLHTLLPVDTKGKLISMATEGDRTIFFDFLPIEIGKIKDFNIRFQMYTVPGQVRYNATRRLVLKGADAIIFVADSQTEMNEQNIESLSNMKDNLAVNNLPLDIPKVFQYNKRDMDNLMSVEELNKTLNKEGYPYFETVAAEGKGINESFERITKDVLQYIKEKHNVDIDVPDSSIIPEDAIPSKSGEHIFIRDSKASAVAEEPVDAPVAETEPVSEPVTAKTAEPVIKSAVAQHEVTPAVEPETVSKPVVKDPFISMADTEPEPIVEPVTTSPAEPAAPAALDLSEIVSAINALKDTVSKKSFEPAPPVPPDFSEIISAIHALKDAVSEISRGLRGIQINQTKNNDLLNEFKQMFSAKEKDKGVKRFFK